MAPKANKTTTKKVEEKPKKFRVQCKAALLTYNEVSLETQADLVEMYNELKVKYPDVKFSVCLEKEARLHCHVFFESDVVVDCDLSHFETKKSGKVGDCKPNNGRNLQRGHWYVQCKWKKSHICSHFDLLVKPNTKWLIDEWRNEKIEKITEALAAEKLLDPRIQMQISAVNNYNEKEKIKGLVGERNERIKEKMHKFAPNDLVEEWKSQFLEEENRYKFLVLCGASRLRKTEFAKSLFENPFIHKDKIDWDGYSWLDNGCVIFDDINLPDHIWKYVRTNKVLFQASEYVSVNTSATNCYKRDVCMVQKPIIICTNDALLEKYVSQPYEEWIKSNCVWINLSQPLPFA